MQSDDNKQLSAVDVSVVARLFGFIDLLRTNNFDIGADDIKAAHIVTTHSIIESRFLLHDALRSIFCQTTEHWQVFPLLFYRYWYSTTDIQPDQTDADASDAARAVETTGLSYFSESLAQEKTLENTKERLEINSGGASDTKTLGRRDFRFVFNPQDMRRIEHIVDDISRRMQKRLRRRTKRNLQKGQLDLRRTARRSLQYNGWPFELIFRRKQRTPARILLLLDVSQSMEVYSYLFLRFARGLLQVFKDTDAYAFHTDLIHIGDELKDKSTERLESRLKNLSDGWLGGTRIAASIQNFNDNYLHHTINKNTVVIVFSDGYDSGDPNTLVEEMKKIKYHCRRLVWVNPLLGRGMSSDKPLPVERSLAAVVPHLDLYASAHNLVSLKNLEAAFRLK